MGDPCGRRQGSGRSPVLGDTLPVLPKGSWRAEDGTAPKKSSFIPTDCNSNIHLHPKGVHMVHSPSPWL